MSIPVVTHKNLSIARCAAPLEDFAQWCGGEVVAFDGKAVAVTMPFGSGEVACWPGDYLLKEGIKMVRLMEQDAHGVLPTQVLDLFKVQSDD